MVERKRLRKQIERRRLSPEARARLEEEVARPSTVRTYFTEAALKKLKRPEHGQVDYVERLKRGRNLVLRISYGGTRAWRVLYYVNAKPRVKTIGQYPDLKLKDARKAAEDFDPDAAAASAEAGSFREVAESWIKHYVAPKGLRSRDEIERQLSHYVYPRWERTPFFEIRRSTVNGLLDKVAEKHGRSQADAVLATLRAMMNWFQTRDENYVSPIVRGMKRDHRSADQRKRSRVLTDAEIRAVWNAAEGQFGGIVKLALLTGSRREKIAQMKWEDVADGVWTIRAEAREKGNAGALKLPRTALDVIEAQPEIDGNPYVFSGSLRGRRHKPAKPAGPPHFNAWSQRKAELDKRLPADMKPWVIHDLRRTARSLLARAGVSDRVAEAVLGHVIAGVEGVYNRHSYTEEKGEALAKLAALIEQIVNPPDRTNVVPLEARREASPRPA